MLRHLKTFESYGKPVKESNSNDIEEGEYISLELIDNGLKVKLNDASSAKGEIGEVSEVSFHKLFEDIEVNSDFKYSDDLGTSQMGLTEAPGFLFSYNISDDGTFEESESSVLYYYNDYMVKNFVEELFENGEVIFTQA
jgi:hypothetical protein